MVSRTTVRVPQQQCRRLSFYSSEFGTISLRPYLTISYANPQSAAIDLDANNSSGATGSGFVTTWTENGGPVTIADLDATLTMPTALTFSQ